MTIEIHAMGDMWHTDRDQRTELGELVRRAKDLGDGDAIRRVGRDFGYWLEGLRVVTASLVAAMPPDPRRPNPLVETLGAIASAATAQPIYPIVRRGGPTARMRDTAPEDREVLAHRAGYVVEWPVDDADILLVDDVVLTGTTLQHVGGLLLDAGAASVTGVVLARSRRR